MKNISESKNHFASLLTVITLSMFGFLTSCDENEPQKEDTPELITKVILTFTPTGAAPVVVVASDPDGEGVQDIQVDGPINLAANTSYTLTIQLLNELADPGEAGYDITAEVEEEGDEHMLFFAWTNNVFSDPAGNGNADNRADDVNYGDEDANNLPLGLQTFWTAGAVSSGDFRVILKHQPGLKTATSGSTVGETDLDLTFDINVQ